MLHFTNRLPTVSYSHLKDVYFTVLDRFSSDDLRTQAAELARLENALEGKTQKNRRKTLRKQRERIAELLAQRLSTSINLNEVNECCKGDCDGDDVSLCTMKLVNPQLRGGFWGL